MAPLDLRKGDWEHNAAILEIERDKWACKGQITPFHAPYSLRTPLLRLNYLFSSVEELAGECGDFTARSVALVLDVDVAWEAFRPIQTAARAFLARRRDAPAPVGDETSRRPSVGTPIDALFAMDGDELVVRDDADPTAALVPVDSEITEAYISRIVADDCIRFEQAVLRLAWVTHVENARAAADLKAAKRKLKEEEAKTAATFAYCRAMDAERERAGAGAVPSGS